MPTKDDKDDSELLRSDKDHEKPMKVLLLLLTTASPPPQVSGSRL